MTFYSLPFLCFLAVTILIYFSTPKRFRWIVLLTASYVFYFVDSKWLIFVLFGQTAVTYAAGLLIRRVQDRGKLYLSEHKEDLSKEERKAVKGRTRRSAKHILLIGAALNLGILLLLKYSNFFIDNANRVLSFSGIRLPSTCFLLPLGISFYTLQALSYLIDIYREKLEPDRNLGKFMLFLSFFPQIVQGPIPRHAQLAAQLYAGHSFDLKRLERGAQLILWGWIKKLIIAEYLALPVSRSFSEYQAYPGSAVFLGAAFYGLQVYADFSGGMDMARGVSEIFGIGLQQNFRQPYFSVSVEDFWRRWHITLGEWMRDYVFYPLSLSGAFTALGRKARKWLGNSAGKRLPSFLSMFLVYFLVGFWHGPEWKYIAYGIWNGIFIASSILLTDVYGRMRGALRIRGDSLPWHIFQILRTFFLITLGRFLSRADSFPIAIRMMGRMASGLFDFRWINRAGLEDLGLNLRSWACLLVFLAIAFAVDLLHERNTAIREEISKKPIVIRWAIYYAAILAIMIFGVYGPEYDPAAFIYEQF